MVCRRLLFYCWLVAARLHRILTVRRVSFGLIESNNLCRGATVNLFSELVTDESVRSLRLEAAPARDQGEQGVEYLGYLAL
jgi:hypothetical protein